MSPSQGHQSQFHQYQGQICCRSSILLHGRRSHIPRYACVSVEKFWFGAPVWPPEPPKGQNFEIFVFDRRTFKIWYNTHFGVLISYQLKKFGFEPPLWPLDPRKVNFLKFLLFSVNPSKFGIILILGLWFHISCQILVWGPRFGPFWRQKSTFWSFGCWVICTVAVQSSPK